MWVVIVVVVVRSLVVALWCGFWLRASGWVGGRVVASCLGAKAFALLVKRNSESESFCVCMGQRAAMIFAIFLLILQIVVNNLIENSLYKVFVFISILFSQSMSFESSICDLRFPCTNFLC